MRNKKRMAIPTFDEWVKPILKEFGAETVSDLTDEQYDELCEELYPVYEVETDMLANAF